MLRKALTIATMLVATAAEAQSPPATQCTEPRPQMCTQIYAPVCGLKGDGSRQTFGNNCSACADNSVRSHAPGECQGVDKKR